MPGLLTPNIVDEAAVEQVSRALDAIAVRGAWRSSCPMPSRRSPDSVREGADERSRSRGVDRWQMRKSVPFRVDEAQVTWAEGQSLEAGGREFVVAIARREVIAQ